jgi:hypothetical protein
LGFNFLPLHHFDITKKLTRDSFFSAEQSSFKIIESNRIEIYFVEEPQCQKPATVRLGVDCILFDNLQKGGKFV